MRYKFVFIFSLMLFLFYINHNSIAAQSNNDNAFWEMDVPPESGWHVGDLIPLRMRVSYPEDAEVALPDLPAQWGSFEIRDQVIMDGEVSDGQMHKILQVTVQLWEVGIHETPETTLNIRKDGEDAYTVTTHPLRVEIVSVIATQTDENSLDKKDLKPQIDLPKPPIWPWLLAAMCLAPLLYLAGRWLYSKLPTRRLTEDDIRMDESPIQGLPEDVAYAFLDQITRMDLPSIGAFKQHYTMVTECIRSYILGIYDVPAIDLTTSELKHALRNKPMDRESLGLLWELLDQADMVKFAKYHPDKDRARRIVILARHFVDCTKPLRSSTPIETVKVE